MVSLEKGILGYLSMKPLSGYDIKKLFDMSAAYFWPADQTQIYKSLKKLESYGMIEVSGYEQNAGPSKRLYAITDKGREELRLWLNDSKISDFISRKVFMMKLFLSGTLSQAELLSFIDDQLEQLGGLIRELRENYDRNRDAFAEVCGMEKDDPRYLAAIKTYEWGLSTSESYEVFLKEIRVQLITGDSAETIQY